MAAKIGAEKVVVTDYPDTDLIENLSYNIDALQLSIQPQRQIVAQGYLWGASVKPLLSHLSDPSHGFDTLILADLLFNHHCHEGLVSTILDSLARTSDARALVFFTPYRPWLLEKDLAFFDMCRERGLAVQNVLKTVMESVMFEEDRGDELLRRTVFGFELSWVDCLDAE